MSHTTAPALDVGPPRLGLRANWIQFLLLLVVNAFVGGMIGIERAVLPLIAEREFDIASKSAILSFILSFGLVKAMTNLFAGRSVEIHGRKRLLVLGWIVALPVPFVLMWAPSWSWVTAANVLLGIHQGLCWSTTVIMKIDLVGPRRRGLAMGLNECVGYGALAVAAFASALLAERFGLRPAPFVLGVVFAAAGLLLSAIWVHDTTRHARAELPVAAATRTPFAVVFAHTSWNDRRLFACSQAGLVNNMNDGMAWGLFPIFFAASGLDLRRIGLLAAIYPAVWAVAQIATGTLSDRCGRKPLIVAGMWVQALGIGLIVGAAAHPWRFTAWVSGCVLLGLGTAMVYPTLLAAVVDAAHPAWRAEAVGIYRFWRDLGYAAGAIVAGAAADALGVAWALLAVALVTFLSGTVVALRMPEPPHAAPRPEYQPATASN